MQPIIKPYNDLLKKIVKNGINTDKTKALFGETIEFNLLPLNENNTYQLILPKQRGKLSTSVKYAIAEAIWYLEKTRTIDTILPYGKIWQSMVNDEGLINSNYGYQIDNNNISFDNIVKNLISNKKENVYIASYNNQFEENDLVCNNKIEFYLEQKDDNYFLSADVCARSIDVIFGLPYDFFSLQGYMAMLGEKLSEKLGSHVKLNNVSFNIANVHWYLHQDPNEYTLEYLSDEVVLVNDNKNTPYTIYRENIEYLKGNIKQLRDLADDNTMSLVVLSPEKNLSDKKEFFNILTFSNKDQALNYLKQTVAKNDEKLNLFLDKIELRLENNQWERKTLIFNKQKDIFYIMYNGKNYIVLKRTF